MNIQQDDAVLRDILDEAVEIPPRSRPTFLDAACGQNQKMRRRLDELLESLDHATDFLVDPTVDAPPTAHNRSPHANSHPLGTQIDKYELQDVIGEGGMGTVYKAHQKWPVRRDVALKVIKLGMDTGKVILRFDTERQALAMMDHPSIAKVLDAGATATGRPFFVMELVRGMPITEYCDQNLLNIQSRLDLFMQVCNAVQHAHQKGIIHRDLKPSNILVTMLDGMPVPKIIDFGIAKATSPTTAGEEPTEVTEVWQMMGTPLYMSPEQVERSGINVDTRGDVYALGVVLYELLTGTTPFDRTRLKSVTRDELCRIIREEVPPRPTNRLLSLSPDLAGSVAGKRQSDPKHLVGDVRGDLDWIVMRSLEKNRDLRYETTSALALELRRFINHEPIEASPPSNWYRMRKFVTRHRGAIGVAGGIAAVLVIATIVSVWQAFRATHAESVAITQQHEAEQMKLVAQQQEVESRHAKRMSDSFSQLLQSTLSGANLTLVDAGSKDRGRDLLDKIAGDIDRRFTGETEAKVEACEVLAEAYEDLGIRDSARQEYKNAYAISINLPGGKTSEQSVRIAAALAYYEGSTAEKTYAQARQLFGDSSPITQKAARSLVHSLSPDGGFGRHRPGEVERALELSTKLVAQVEQQPVDATTPQTYQIMNQHAVLLNAVQEYEDAEQVVRRALKRADEDGHIGGIARGALGFSLTESLAAQGKLPQAAKVAAATYEDDRIAIGDFHLNSEKMLKRYVEILADLGRSAEGVKLIKQSLARARQLYPNGGRPVVSQLILLSQYCVDNGLVASGVIEMANATKLQLEFQNGDLKDGKYCQMVREVLLLRLGAKLQAPDGSVRAQVFCALNEIWCDHPQEAPPLDSLEASGIRYSLQPWGRINDRGTITGTLADAKPVTPPKPGIYLMTVEISAKNSATRTHSKWVLIADWDTTFTGGQHIDAPGDPPEYRAREKFILQTRTPAITLLNSFADNLNAPAPLEIARGKALVELPAGRFRFVVSSVDGAHLYVDARHVINAWSAHRARRDTWGLELDAGTHELKFDHVRKGRGNLLWIRIEPVSLAAPGSVAIPNLSEVRTLNFVLNDLDGPAGADAKSTQGGLLAHDGRFPAAAAHYQAAILMEPVDPFLRQQAALLGLLNQNIATYGKECIAAITLTSNLDDRTATAHTAIIAMLSSGPNVNAIQLQKLLGIADPEKSRVSERAICQVAQGLNEYRRGGYDRCISILTEASGGRLTDEARIAANLFKAMAMRQQGNSSEALMELRRLQKAFGSLPSVHQAELDPPQIQDRLIAQVALREAVALLDPSTSTTRPATRSVAITHFAPALAPEPARRAVE